MGIGYRAGAREKENSGELFANSFVELLEGLVVRKLFLPLLVVLKMAASHDKSIIMLLMSLERRAGTVPEECAHLPFQALFRHFVSSAIARQARPAKDAKV